jgi:hypothetical protein
MAFRFEGAAGLFTGPFSVPSPLPMIAEMMFVVLLAVVTSARWSLFRSVVAIHQGAEAANGRAGSKFTAASAAGASTPSTPTATAIVLASRRITLLSP